MSNKNKSKNKMDRMLELDDEAHKLCKPYGCKVTRCLSKVGNQDCAPLISALNTCIQKTK